MALQSTDGVKLVLRDWLTSRDADAVADADIDSLVESVALSDVDGDAVSLPVTEMLSL